MEAIYVQVGIVSGQEFHWIIWNAARVPQMKW